MRHVFGVLFILAQLTSIRATAGSRRSDVLFSSGPSHASDHNEPISSPGTRGSSYRIAFDESDHEIKSYFFAFFPTNWAVGPHRPVFRDWTLFPTQVTTSIYVVLLRGFRTGMAWTMAS